MNTTKRIRMAVWVAGAGLASQSSDARAAAVWETVLEHQQVPGLSATSGDIGTDADGMVYSVGSVTPDVEGNRTAVVLASADQGATWSMVDEYSDPAWPSAHFRGFGADANGGLYAAGRLYSPTGPELLWIVRESHDGGASWLTDAFQHFPGARANCADVKVAPSGDVYAVGVSELNWIVRKKPVGAGAFATVDSVPMATGSGYLADAARAVDFHPTAGVFVVGRMPWTVRRSSDGGQTWRSVDVFQGGSWQTGSAEDIVVDGSGAVYVAGFGLHYKGNKGTWYWVVRRSTDGGATWKTVDQFAYGTAARATGMTIDASGKISVCGYAETTQGDRWLVRRGTPGAKGSIAWATSDTFPSSADPFASAQAWDITGDAAGNLFVTGLAGDPAGVAHWIIRRLNAP